MEIKFKIFIGKVEFDYIDNRWVWFPTVQESVMVNDNGHYKVVESETNYHLASYINGEGYDNYDRAFAQAINLLKDVKPQDMRMCEENYERIFNECDWKDMDFSKKQKRKIIFEDISLQRRNEKNAQNKR